MGWWGWMMVSHNIQDTSTGSLAFCYQALNLSIITNLGMDNLDLTAH